MTMSVCPACDETIKLPVRVNLGQRLTCPHCDTELEVIELDPVELDWAYDEFDDDLDDDDWDDDDNL